MSRPVTHVVRVQGRRAFISDTLPAPAVESLEAAFRAAPWWRDRWSAPGFRAAARQVLREHGGLVLIGPGMPFEVPAPFVEFFEPIEVGVRSVDRLDQLKTLSGLAPTRQERWRWIAALAAIVAWFVLVIPAVLAFIRGGPSRSGAILVGALLIAALVVAGIMGLRGLSGRWFLVPGAIAVVRRPARRGRAARVTVLSRKDTCAVFRYVSTGKTTVLVLELWSHAGKRLRRAVSQREAISILAAWQSRLEPPPDERLQELVNW